jgi:DNA-binding PadR family transcriptional regulator
MSRADQVENIQSKVEQELRRGVVVLAVLTQLRTPQYGYSLRQTLSDQGMSIEEGTLYPLLRRLEAQGLLASEWRIEDGPPRRYYVLSKAGSQLQRSLTASWRDLVDTMAGILDGRSSWLVRAK